MGVVARGGVACREGEGGEAQRIGEDLLFICNINTCRRELVA